MQKQYDVDYAGKTKSHFKFHPVQKALIFVGLGAAAVEMFGFHNIVLSAASFVGPVAGGMALSEVVNAKSSIAKSAFLFIGGVALTGVASFAPFVAPVLQQVTNSMTVAGGVGLIEIGVNKYRNRKNRF